MGESQVWIHSGEERGGRPVLYRLTRDEFWEKCSDCVDGVCVQRVYECDGWRHPRVVRVVHRQQRATN